MFPTKVGVVLDLIGGKNVNETFTILKYTPGDTTEVISKALKSAITNAENNHELDASRLFVAGAHVGREPALKRFRPMGYGKAFRVNKRTSDVTLVVKERVQ